MKLKKAKFLLLSAIAGLAMGIGAAHAGDGCTAGQSCDSNGQNCRPTLTCCWMGVCTTSELPR